MESTETIDAMDAVGSAIRVDTRGGAVMRILPRNNDAVNEEWISDKTRHVADGLKIQRLDQPYIRRNGRLEPASWDEALGLVADKIKAAKPDKTGAVAGDLAAAEEMFALKDLLGHLGVVSLDCRQAGDKLDPKLGRASYVFNSSIEGIEQADAILIVGSNPRLEAPVLNARIRKRWRADPSIKIALIGAKVDLTYPHGYLGAGPETLADIASGKHPFAEALKDAKHPMVIVGQGAYARPDGLAVLSLAARIVVAASSGKDATWNGFNVLHTAAGRVAGLDLGFVPGKGGKDLAGILGGGMELVYLLGADECDLSKLGSAFVVYQGSHGDRGAERADVILPGAAYTEKHATYVNTEGRVQHTMKAAFSPGSAKEDWTIIRALSARADATLSYNTLKELRAAMYRAAPQLAAVDSVETRAVSGLETLAKLSGQTTATPFGSAIGDFYLTNPIARASAVMAGMSALRSSAEQKLTAAE
jgi:NADH-quinone oxidoreductase subunit G